MRLRESYPLGIPHQQHPDQELGIDRWAACVALDVRKVRPDTAQINKPINRPQLVILPDMILQGELIKQRRLRFPSPVSSSPTLLLTG